MPQRFHSLTQWDHKLEIHDLETFHVQTIAAPLWVIERREEG